MSRRLNAFRLALVALVATGLVALAAPAAAQWRQLDGPRPPVVGALGLHDGVVLLATNENDQGGTWRSLDGGARWDQTGFATGGGASLLSAGATVYQGTYLGGLWRSSDAGQTWTPVPDVASGTVEALDARGDTLYAATTDGAPAAVARSFDGGQTWTPGGGTVGRPAGVLARPGGVVLVAMGGNGLFRSTDAGATWAVPAGLPAGARIAALAADGLAPDGPAVFALVGAGLAENGLWRSTDDGASWSRVGPPVSVGERGEALVVDGPLVVAATGPGVIRSDDDGQTWVPFRSGLAATTLATSFVVHGGALVVGTQFGGAYRLDGATWTPLGPDGMVVDGLASSDAGLVAVGEPVSGGSVVHVYHDGAWASLDGDLAETEASHVTVRGDRVLVAGRQFGLWQRTLAGVAAEPVAAISNARLGVSPNPARAGSTVRVSGAEAGAEVRVIDALGRTVAVADAAGTVAPGLAPGVYAVRAGSRTGRLVVVR